MLNLHTLQRVGLAVLRYGLVFLLVFWGAYKFTALEAEGIRPLVTNSPFMSWLYKLLSGQGVSNLIGIVEIVTGLLMATRHWSPRISGIGSLAATGIFLLTLSFMFTTPGPLSPENPVVGFLLKDIMLLGGALYTAAEALLAHRAQAMPVAHPPPRLAHPAH